MVKTKFSKKDLSILLAVVLVTAIGVVVFLSLYEISNAKVEPPAPSYIANSRIFLLSANSSYGYNALTQCFIIRLTVRNDYTSQNPVGNERDNTEGFAWFILVAKLYDKNGNQINAQAFTPPGKMHNYNQQGLHSGETTSFTVTMATASHDIDHYILVFGWLGSYPAP